MAVQPPPPLHLFHTAAATTTTIAAATAAAARKAASPARITAQTRPRGSFPPRARTHPRRWFWTGPPG